MEKRSVSQINRAKLFDYLKQHPCVDCGESRPEVLEFDHVRGKKVRGKDGCTIDVSSMVSRKYSWKAIEKEIKKCDVRCANCHRIRTVKTRGWYKGLTTLRKRVL